MLHDIDKSKDSHSWLHPTAEMKIILKKDGEKAPSWGMSSSRKRACFSNRMVNTLQQPKWNPTHLSQYHKSTRARNSLRVLVSQAAALIWLAVQKRLESTDQLHRRDMRVQAVLLTSTKETISLLILSSQRVPLKTCKACNYCGEQEEYQEKKKSYPRLVIIFNILQFFFLMTNLKSFFGKIFLACTFRKGTERQRALLKLLKCRASIQQMQQLT